MLWWSGVIITDRLRQAHCFQEFVKIDYRIQCRQGLKIPHVDFWRNCKSDKLLANNTITDQLTDFDIKGLKPTVTDSGCEIILRTKTTKKTVATLHVNVFEKIEVKVAIYTVHDTRQTNTNVDNRPVSDPDIENKLNEVYGPQANLNFTVDTTLSKDLNMGENTNDPVLLK